MSKLRLVLVGSATVLGLAACSEPTAPTTFGRLIARAPLTLADGNQLPCCTVTSPRGSVTVVGGALSLYASAHYVDTLFTPGGLMSAACVQEIPNGGHVALNGLVTLPDGSSYLQLRCSVGSYRLTLTEHVVHQDGSSETSDVLLTEGTFTWQRDRLTLRPSEGSFVSAALSGATLVITVPGHRYQLVATAIP